MSGFKFQERADGNELHLDFEGSIDEDAEFPNVDVSTINKVCINLQGIKTINSVGIREWLDWIRPVADKAQIVLTHAPKAMVFQFNMVEGFLPPKAVVESFYVPYFCESNDTEENVLFTIGREIQVTGGNVKVAFDPKSIKGATEDCEFEMDVTESKYFQFLKRV